MSRIQDALKVVPVVAWLVAAAIWVVMIAVVRLDVIPQQHLTGRRDWVEMILAESIIPLFLSVYVLLIGYVNGDARRRGMRYVAWTLLATFIPYAIGVLLYFLVRESIMRNCPTCSNMVPDKFAFCPSCGSALAQTCSSEVSSR